MSAIKECEQPAEVDRWDGTLAHINKIARRAVRGARFSTSSGFDQHDTASSAIAMQIAEAPDTPVEELVHVGYSAIAREHQMTLSQHGVRVYDDASGERFAAYWLGIPHHFDSYNFSKAALHQVFNALEYKQRQDLLGAANYGSVAAYAETLGLNPSTVSTRIKQAREAALRLWFDWETPPPLKQMTLRHMAKDFCPQGHDQSVYRRWTLTKKHGRRAYCGECHRERGRARSLTK